MPATTSAAGRASQGTGPMHRGVAEGLHARGDAVERLRARDAEIGALEDREAGERDDERRNAGARDQIAVDEPRRRRRSRDPPTAARTGGKPHTCIRPAKQIADRPPIAPIARFIWPMAMMTICDIAITQFTDAASSRIWMLNGERNEGSKDADADRGRHDDGERAEPVGAQKTRKAAVIAPGSPFARGATVARDPSAPRAAAAGPSQVCTQNSPMRYCSKSVRQLADQHGTEERAEHRDAAAREQPCRREPARGTPATASPVRDRRPSREWPRPCARRP